MGIKRNLQKFLDKADYRLYRHKAVIGNRPYQWCDIPVPDGYPQQSQTHPAIQYIPDSWNGYTHWLATTPYPNADTKYENPCIYRANEQSGMIPTVYFPVKQNPIVPFPDGKAFNSDPELFFENDQLFCIVRENENNHYLREIKLLSSFNGEDWSEPQTIITSNDEKRQLLSPAYIKTGNQHRIYFLNGDAGVSKYGSCSGIEIFESENLNPADFRLAFQGQFLNSREIGIEPWHFDLFRYKGLLYMVLCGRVKNRKTLRSPMETFLAISENDANFRIFKTPVIRHLKSYRPSAYIDEQGYFRLYFSIVGLFLKDGSDRNIAVTSILFEDLLCELGNQ
jgi:hypothetical protein